MEKMIAELVLVCIFAAPALAQGGADKNLDGEGIYEQQSCAVCHVANKDMRVWGLGPSWKQIGEVYGGHADKLSKFLRGESKPLIEGTGNAEVDRASYRRMHEQIVRLKTLSESERKALEKFVMARMIEESEQRPAGQTAE